MVITCEQEYVKNNNLSKLQKKSHLARDNIKIAQDKAHFYAYHNRDPHVHNSNE